MKERTPSRIFLAIVLLSQVTMIVLKHKGIVSARYTYLPSQIYLVIVGIALILTIIPESWKKANEMDSIITPYRKAKPQKIHLKKVKEETVEIKDAFGGEDLNVN